MARRPSRRRRALAVVAAATVSLTVLGVVVAVCAATACSANECEAPSGVGRGHGARRWWVRDRRQCWWDGDAQDLDDADFRSYFRMEWSSFYALADDLRPDVQGQKTRFRASVDYEAAVAMALYRLATGAYKTLASC